MEDPLEEPSAEEQGANKELKGEENEQSEDKVSGEAGEDDELALMRKKYDIQPTQEPPAVAAGPTGTAPATLQRSESVSSLLSKLQARKEQLGFKANIQVAKTSRFQLKTQELQQQKLEQNIPRSLNNLERSLSGATMISLDPKLCKVEQIRRDLGLDLSLNPTVETIERPPKIQKTRSENAKPKVQKMLSHFMPTKSLSDPKSRGARFVARASDADAPSISTQDEPPVNPEPQASSDSPKQASSSQSPTLSGSQTPTIESETTTTASQTATESDIPTESDTTAADTAAATPADTTAADTTGSQTPPVEYEQGLATTRAPEASSNTPDAEPKSKAAKTTVSQNPNRQLKGAKYFDTEASEDEAEGDLHSQGDEDEGDEISKEEQEKLEGFIDDGTEEQVGGSYPRFEEAADQAELDFFVKKFVHIPLQKEGVEQPEPEEEPTQEDEPGEDEETGGQEQQPVLTIAGQIHREKKPISPAKQSKWQRDFAQKASHKIEEAKLSDDDEEGEAIAAQKKEKAELKLRVMEEKSVHSVTLDGSSRQMLSKIKKTNISRTLSASSFSASFSCFSSSSSATPTGAATSGPLNFADLNKEVTFSRKQSSFFSALSTEAPSASSESKEKKKPAGAKQKAPKASTTRAVVFRSNSLGGNSLSGMEDKPKLDLSDANKSQGSSDFSAFLRPARATSFSEKLMQKGGAPTLSRLDSDSSVRSLSSLDLSQRSSSGLSELSRCLSNLSSERSRSGGSGSDVQSPKPPPAARGLPKPPSSSASTSATKRKKGGQPPAMKGVLAFKKSKT